jgi:uncharacterized protein YaiI (UPF0178 family)
MHTLFIDADACPVKSEAYRVAGRYGWRVVVAANSPLKVPTDPLVELVVRSGFGAVDDWIAETVGPGDVVITADIPLAARALAKDAQALSPKGHAFTDNDIGGALAMRQLMDDLRQDGSISGGPAPMKPKDRSRFLSTLDVMLNKAKREYPKGE